MVSNPGCPTLVLTGPTGSGKTKLGLKLAERLGAEIISMDSMALYRAMNIGTAKPSQAERQRIPHHLIDVLEPWEKASVAWWLGRAAQCYKEIQDRGRSVLFVGGTPLYLKALLRGLFAGPSADEMLRQRLTEMGQKEGNQALHNWLARVDPATAGRLHPNDIRRVIRALEVWELTGQPLSNWQQQWQLEEKKANLDTKEGLQEITVVPNPNIGLAQVWWIDLPRKDLYDRITQRVSQMVENGLVEEARSLRKLSFPLSREASQALGYKEMFAYLDGSASLSETIKQIQIRSRNFAKRQLSWFRNLQECQPLTPELTYSLWGLTID